jgi:hypothetical protein
VAKKKNPAFVWLNEVNGQSLLAALLHGDSAFQGFLKYYSAIAYCANDDCCLFDDGASTIIEIL